VRERVSAKRGNRESTYASSSESDTSPTAPCCAIESTSESENERVEERDSEMRKSRETLHLHFDLASLRPAEPVASSDRQTEELDSCALHISAPEQKMSGGLNGISPALAQLEKEYGSNKKEWKYEMRREAQEIVPGQFLSPSLPSSIRVD
jgi:hypothetical protein